MCLTLLSYNKLMEENLNDNEKRVRKRIVVKRDSSENKPEKPIINFVDPYSNYPKGENGPIRDYNNSSDNGGYKKPPYKNFSNSNEKRSFDPNRPKPQGFKGSNFGPRKNNFKPPVENPHLSHQFFKKHEAGPIVIPSTPSSSPANTELIRLNKFIANAGICSRREADELITKGLIFVNGEAIKELGFKINRKDIVEYKGKRVTEANHVYILLNKPKDTITTTSDPEKRVTVMDLVQKATDQRIFPIGRLDRNTTGIILLTNDGDFAQKLSHPSSEIKKVYYAVLEKPLEREHFEKLVEGVELEDGIMRVDEVAYVDPNDHCMIGVEIHSGKNRIVHRMFEHLGYRLKKLDRVVYAGLDKGGLRRGKWRFLKFNEVQMVLNSIK